MNEYFFANYRLLTDTGILNHEIVKKQFADFAAPLPYTHTFTWRLGDVDELEEKRTWVQGFPVAYEDWFSTVYGTDGGWAFVSNHFYERYHAGGAKSVVLCSRDYGELTFYIADRFFEIERNEHTLHMQLHRSIRAVCMAGMVLRSGLPLHASMVEKDDFGVLFLGPSGRGKSTQAKLWEQYLGADFLIGDSPVMRKIGGKWIGFGMPWDGPRDAICRQTSVPVRALVWLEKAMENSISPMSPVQAMSAILQQVIEPYWDDAAMDGATALMGALVREVPMFRLRCLPDEAAARLTYETICKG